MKYALTSISLLALAACGSSQADAPRSTAAGPANTGSSAGDGSHGADSHGADSHGADSQATTSGFTLQDLDGQEVSLTSFKGKTVVLEWFSPACPFSEYAHGQGPLTDMAARVTAEGDVVWLAINSSSRGQAADPGYNREAATRWGIQHPILMDSHGKVGRKYGAKTTPHMFILDGDSEVVYSGALDNAPRGDQAGEYVNYVEAALDDIAAGRPVATSETKAYGCGVKY